MTVSKTLPGFFFYLKGKKSEVLKSYVTLLFMGTELDSNHGISVMFKHEKG